jgi:hypothetical protein
MGASVFVGGSLATVRDVLRGPIPTGRAEIERRIVQRAQADPSFRERLLSAPREAVSEILGVEVPAGLQIDVEVERPDRICVVLPVDLSGMGHDAVWAMLGRRPDGWSREGDGGGGARE